MWEDRREESQVDRQEQSRWRPTGRQVLWGVGIVIALVVLILQGYAFQWTGFGQSEVNEDIQPYKTLWDWLDLLIVSVVLAIGGYLFNSSQNRAAQRAAERRAQGDALEAYLDVMSDMLTPKKVQPSLSDEHPPDSLRSVARARTVSLLARLDAGPDGGEIPGKGYILRFLSESGLIKRGAGSWEEPVVRSQERTSKLSEWSELAPAKHNIGTDSEGAGTDRCRRGIRSLGGMNSHLAEVVAEA
jgi:hypothetical protein